jgi:hypothetical protein
MTLEAFIWSVAAGILATILVGTTYKIINKNKTKKTINQKGNNNTAFMDSTININSEKNSKGEK